MPILRVELKQEKPFDVELLKEAFTIGRSSNNDLTFNNLSLSRHHAKILHDGEKWSLEDSGSRNGTFLNGIRLNQNSLLKHGDVIQLGEIVLRFIDPLSERLQVTDTSPSLGMNATFMLDTDKLNLRKYTQEAKSGGFTAALDENIWPALNQAAAALITHYPIDKLVEVVMDIVFQAVPAERGALILLNAKEPNELNIKSVRNSGGGQNLQISRTIIQEVLQNRKAVLTMDAQSDDRFEAAQSIQMQGIRSIICVPLWNEREVIGLIYIDNLIARRTFTQQDLRLIALIANMAAVKLENAMLLEEQIQKKRMEEQLVVAAQIQRRLLPQFNPEIHGYEVFGINHSCYEIGGDYYDFIQKSDGKLGIVIADVSGKGVGAALLMAAFQASLRTLALSEKDPANLMSQINSVMLQNSTGNKYITVFYGELDLTSGTFQYVNAGHNPPLFMRNGDHSFLKASGPVVGIVPGAKYSCNSVVMQPGDLLFMYTDGITECYNPQEEEFGEDGVVKFMQANRYAAVDELSTLLENHLREFTNDAPPIDDATLVLVKRADS